MKLLVPCVVVLLVGAAVGIGVGMMMGQSKLEEKQIQIAKLEEKVGEMETQVKKSKKDSEATIQKAAKQIAQQKKDMGRMTNMMRSLSSELQLAKAELAKAKAAKPPVPDAVEESVAKPTRETASPARKPTPTKPAAVPTDVPTREYVVKEGDSLWVIAVEQLDEGIRYKEIIEVNPGMTEKTVLKKGQKIRIPSQ